MGIKKIDCEYVKLITHAKLTVRIVLENAVLNLKVA